MYILYSEEEADEDTTDDDTTTNGDTDDDENTDDGEENTDDDGTTDDDEESEGTSIDISNFTLSSSTALLIDSDTVASIIEAGGTLCIEFTTDSTDYASAWLTVCMSDWTYEISTGVYGQSSADTYILAITTSGATCTGSTNGSMSVTYKGSSWASTSTANTLSTYSSSGIYLAAEYCTLSSVYYK